MKEKTGMTWREPAEFHTNAFDLGITPLQASKNAAHFGLSILFSLADIESGFLAAQAGASQDHRYIRMNAKKEEGEKDRYKISLQITKDPFSAPDICAAFNIPGTVPKRCAIAALDAFEKTCLSTGASVEKYTYFGQHYSALTPPDAPHLKNG